MMCASCREEIPAERLEILPETKVCVKCSSVKPYRAIINVSVKHKIVEVTPAPADDPIFDYIDDPPHKPFPKYNQDE